MCSPLRKSLTVFLTEICDLPTLFMTVAADTVALNIIFERLLFMVLHNDERAASSKKNIPNSRLEYKVYKTHPLFKTKMAKLISYLIYGQNS